MVVKLGLLSEALGDLLEDEAECDGGASGHQSTVTERSQPQKDKRLHPEAHLVQLSLAYCSATTHNSDATVKAIRAAQIIGIDGGGILHYIDLGKKILSLRKKEEEGLGSVTTYKKLEQKLKTILKLERDDSDLMFALIDRLGVIIETDTELNPATSNIAATFNKHDNVSVPPRRPDKQTYISVAKTILMYGLRAKQTEIAVSEAVRSERFTWSHYEAISMDIQKFSSLVESDAHVDKSDDWQMEQVATMLHELRSTEKQFYARKLPDSIYSSVFRLAVLSTIEHRPKKNALDILDRKEVKIEKMPPYEVAIDERQGSMERASKIEIQAEFFAATLSEVPRIIKAARKAANLTQQQLADRMGTSRTTIVKLENDNENAVPSLSTVARVAEATGCPLVVMAALE